MAGLTGLATSSFSAFFEPVLKWWLKLVYPDPIGIIAARQSIKLCFNFSNLNWTGVAVAHQLITDDLQPRMEPFGQSLRHGARPPGVARGSLVVLGQALGVQQPVARLDFGTAGGRAAAASVGGRSWGDRGTNGREKNGKGHEITHCGKQPTTVHHDLRCRFRSDIA